MYGKLINGVLEYAPEIYTIEHIIEPDNIVENLKIINFNKNIELVKKYGFKEVIDVKPEYTDKQIVVVIGYEETDEYITVQYEVKDKELTLEEKFYEYTTTQNRLQLKSMYSADRVTFRVDTEVLFNTRLKQDVDYDVFKLLKDVVEVGIDNYDRLEIEEMMDFYVSIGKLDYDMWDELWLLMELQHNPPVEEEVPIF